MATIGKQDATATTDLENRTVDTMTGDGSDTTLVLSSTPISINNVLVFISGVLQRPTTDYTLSGSTITFSEAPLTGLKVVAIAGGGEHIGIPLTRLDASKFSNSAVTDAKIATGISASKLTGALPALDGSALTGVSSANVSGVDTVSANDPTTTTNPASVGHIWLNRVSGEMFVCTDNTVGANIWTNIGEGSGGVPAYMSATNTNGTETTQGDYKVVTFNTSGSFTPSIGTDATHGNKVEYLVIGGGGAGGWSDGGGGGAGGYQTNTSFAVTGQDYTITVGAGGTGATGVGNGTDGVDSTFSTVTGDGGGEGGDFDANGSAGGSGGGGGGNTGTTGGSATQGQAGGAGHTGNGTVRPGGGGGGHTGVGVDGSGTTAGAGGAGTANSITGSSVTRAGGGGGGIKSGNTAGAGGTGGGGAGGSTSGVVATSGTANTGGGGGGGVDATTAGSGAGGSGVVIIRYKFQ